MADAEQEQQQRAFGPLAQRRRADGGHQGQGVNRKAALTQVLEGLQGREPAAEQVSGDVQRRRQPGRADFAPLSSQPTAKKTPARIAKISSDFSPNGPPDAWSWASCSPRLVRDRAQGTRPVFGLRQHRLVMDIPWIVSYRRWLARR
jgi:hypothetical protein